MQGCYDDASDQNRNQSYQLFWQLQGYGLIFPYGSNINQSTKYVMSFYFTVNDGNG
jgi:hypothetical protein